MTFEIDNMTSLVAKTIFVALRFEVFGNLRKADVGLLTTAVESRFRKQKMLLDSPELKAINKANIAVKQAVYDLCLPGDELDGMRLVPFANVEKVEALMREHEDHILPALVEQFIAVYDTQRTEAEAELKEQFNAALYPTKEEMRKQFSARHRFKSFDVPSKLAEIKAEIFTSEQQKAAAELQSATTSVIGAMRAAAHTAVQKLAEGLSGETTVDGKPKKLFAKHITKLQEFVKDFNIMNAANDTELAADMEKLKLIMEGVSIETVRENEGFKNELTSKISEVAAHMASLAETSTGRKFRT